MRFVVPLVTLNMQISNVTYNILVLVEAAPNTRCLLNSDKIKQINKHENSVEMTVFSTTREVTNRGS